MQIEDKYLVIQMPEEIDHHQAVLIRKQADEKIVKGEIQDVIFDFSATRVMDSSGIGMIMGRQRVVSNFGGHIYIANASSRIHDILCAAGLQKIVSFITAQEMN
ncbi:MAG: anti-sigma factor antagonist [Lachnospiraceae bacterium]|nr:anti-sigma factor antagonist [Lachnospiraceae bacterium]